VDRPELSELAIAPAETDADLEAMIVVRKIVTPRARPNVANLRHALESSTEGLTFIVARLGAEPVACGFVEGPDADYAPADIAVVPERRGMGIGSAVLAYVSERARGLGKDVLQLQVVRSDERSRSFLERRGFRKVGGEEAVSLRIGAPPQPSVPPDGIRIFSRRQRPEVVEAMYEVYVECDQDVPGSSGPVTFEGWRALDIDRPSRSPDLSFVAFQGDEVVGYVVADLFGDEGHHGFTAVKRGWRRRGVATALKRAQITAATELGLKLLVTGSEERNLPMRTLNAKLGYQPDPELSVVVLRGPVQA
jgi:GNAT superfamily N-acetyltransferase